MPAIEKATFEAVTAARGAAQASGSVAATAGRGPP